MFIKVIIIRAIIDLGKAKMGAIKRNCDVLENLDADCTGFEPTL